MTRSLAFVALVALALAASACGGSSSSGPVCNTVAQAGCAAGQYCEPLTNGGVGCFAPVLLRGTVLDPTAVTTALDGARVVALDANRAPVSTVAVSASGGAYELKVRATRDTSGKPVSASVTLRADRQDYQTFPGGIRPALPIDLSTAAPSGTSWIVSGPLTALQLLPLVGGGTAYVHGTVAKAPGGAAQLVVAEPVSGGAGLTGVADRDGSYAVFNLALGTSYVVTAYAKGANYVPVTTGVLTNVDNSVSLSLAGAAAATVSGDLIFNNGATQDSDVTLVIESTYLSTLDRGESAPGLTVHAAGNSPYAFTGVPDGKYVVLAAFGIDGNVRDLSSSSGMAAAPRVTVSGAPVSADSFKIVPAVDLLTIGGTSVGADPILVVTTVAPEFAWSRGSVDALAKTYRVLVFDAFGDQAWSHDMAASANDSVAYAGSTLQAGMPYQLRILAIKETIPVPSTFEQLTQTEDLAGVFTYQP
ncbi:MAG TPA: carboxypeptidase regulatory-like domain-containing protein [Anaeromyxobacter sp.]